MCQSTSSRRLPQPSCSKSDPTFRWHGRCDLIRQHVGRRRNVKQCAVLIVNCSGHEIAHRQALLRRGFRVDEMAEWPSDEVVTQYEVVVLVLRELDRVAVGARRVRGKPK